MDKVPAFVSVVFMITTFVTVGIFLLAVRSLPSSRWSRLLAFAVPFGLVLQFVIGSGGVFQNTTALPPRLFVFGAAPSLALIAVLFWFARDEVVLRLSLPVLTILHTIRVPVELVLAWLADASAVPQIMTFHGTNFDIISGITAPLAFVVALRTGPLARWLLAGWNVAAFALLLNVVITAVFCVPSPIQKLAFDQPNMAVLYFPYSWLPTVVVPIVLFSHLAALYQLFAPRPR